MKSPQQAQSNQELDSEVFIVNGHDNEAKQTIARFITQLGLTPIILHEQANGENTVIEKFEHHANRAGFAIYFINSQ